MEARHIVVAVLLIAIGIALLMMPLVHYVRSGWHAKRKDIMDGLDAGARAAYFKMFCRSGPEVSDAAASEQFETLHTKWYGRRYFWAPGILFCVVGAVAVTFVAFTGMERLQFITIPNPLVRLPDTAMAAVAGAYLWIVFDLISRARRLDFAPSDLDTAIVRFVVAVPLGYAFGALATPSIRPFIAFAMGAFPVAMIGSMARRLANKALNQEQTQEERRNDLVKLQGVNRAILERLEKEDITTVTQIAYCDPVRLTMRSNLSFNFVTDCMNQALAWMYLEKDLDVIRPLGLRGAAEIKDLVDAYDDYDSQDSYGRAEHKRAVGAMPSIANALNQDPNTVQIVFRQIAEDPFTDFLCKVWCDPLRSPRPSGSELGFDVLVYRPA